MTALQIENLITIIGALLATGGLGGVAWFGVGELRVRAARRSRLAMAGGGPAPAAAPKGVVGEQVVGAIRRLGQQSAVRDPAKLSVLRTQLMQAGYFNREAPVIFLGVKAAAMAAATAVVLLFVLPMIMRGDGGPAGVLLAVAFSAVAMLGPEQVLKARRQTREREYAEGFPDLLDLLVASVEAGLSLDAAVTRVTDELDRRYPNLTIHLRMLVLELRAGRARKDSWTSFADRLGIDDARSLATMLRQAEEMGTSLGETLSVFSQDMRAKRMLRAEEKALALSAKLTVPLILFIFPCLLGALMLPAAVRLVEVFSKG
ncbi:type II secretion system F family protein [Phenylobacterium sp. LjRoot219]|uniref:type II secretion system F family protein n=1 Tax=Phenylobacterium sp. LjRoot219 TaxID=3342283 RepID=UPI003ECC6969